MAVDLRLIREMGDGSLALKANVTRAQALTMIAVAYFGDDSIAATEGANAPTGFGDDAPIAAWARPAISYTLRQDIVSLSDHANLGPNEAKERE